MDNLDNMIFGEDPRVGFTRNGTFYHPDMKFQFPFPENWQVINLRLLVSVDNADQDAVSIMTIDSKLAGA